MPTNLWQFMVWGRCRHRRFSAVATTFLAVFTILMLFPQRLPHAGLCTFESGKYAALSIGLILPVTAIPKIELLEVLFAANHSLANDYGVSYEPYGMYMESGEPYSEPLLVDAADSGSIHIVYHHCPYTDAALRGWRFEGNQFITANPGETPLLLSRREKMCVARRVEIRSDGEQEGSELTLTAGDRQEPRFFGYRVDEQGYIAYFVAFTRMLPSACVNLQCCVANSNLPCEIVFYDVRAPEKLSLFEKVVGSPSVNLSHDCPLCLHYGGEDGVPLEYFTSIEEYQLSQDCPNLKPHTYGDSFVFLGPGTDGSRVHKHFAIGSLSNTLQIREFGRMTQVSVQYPNNLWLSRAGAYHENFYPPEAMRSYYIVRGAEYTRADESREKLQQVLFYYDSLSNAQENKGSSFISNLKKPEVANTKIPDAIFAEHPIANDVTYFHSNPVESEFRFVAGGGFKLPSVKFASPATIKGFCAAPLFYDQWAVFLALEETASQSTQQRQKPSPTARSDDASWETTPLPWWDDTALPEFSKARRGQLLYMQVPISGSRSYNEMTLRVFNADSYRSFHCSAAGSTSVLLLHHDTVNHILHVEERLRDGSLIEESQIEIRRVLHGSLLPTRTVTSLQKAPDSVIWINLLTTKRFSVDESFYYVPAELPGRIASVQRATGFYTDGDCLGEWSPSLSTANCSEFCVSLHAYQVKVASRGGSACAFQAGVELAKHCLESPCSRVDIGNILINRQPVNADGEPDAASASMKNGTLSLHTQISGPSATLKFAGRLPEELTPQLDEQMLRSFDKLGNSESPEIQLWQDGLLDTSTQIQLGANGEALVTVELKSVIDLWHIRLAFVSVAGTEAAQVASFNFSLSVVDDSGEDIHTWETSVPPSPAAQSVWEAMDLRLYRAKTISIKATQPFRIAEFQVFGMPLETCPPGGFLGPSSCSVPVVQRLTSHLSLDCQGAWSEWTAFMQVYQTEKEGGIPCEFFQHEPCADGLCNSVFGVSLLRAEDCYPSPSRWSECIGCRQMRVWHILRAAAAEGKPCPSSIFETRTCTSGEGCEVSLVTFPVPPDQPATDDDGASNENDLMRPIGGVFLLAAVGCVLLLLAGLEMWRRWGTSMAAYREVINMQRQRDLMAAREQMIKYKKMIQEYKDQVEREEGKDASQEEALEQLDSLLMQHVVTDTAEEEQTLKSGSGTHTHENSDNIGALTGREGTKDDGSIDLTKLESQEAEQPL
ncbi:hypothetical protein, conserved [Eimeria necatrix]|uniref:Uncharacterized protein n=1 Tax=Eimeria necatrix TaxID=51315 RepID=U6MZU5_9EIME|nr:hypothetical protein, conserved [Eimeria necatrix]CDJ69758.1 hypothetical protein, conserved [Eimeria necatrix]